MPTALANALASQWTTLAIRGACALALGILSFAWPAITLKALVLLWGVYALLDGGIAFLGGLRTKVWSLVLIGVLGILAGIITFRYPGLTALILLYVIAAWAIATGVLAIYLAVRLRKELTNEWILALAGALSVAFGVMLIAKPGAGALSVVFIIGAYAVVFGILLLTLAFKLKGLPRRIETMRTT
jgi:uncharacterized membrane protein HdeD (DUF308 family)